MELARQRQDQRHGVLRHGFRVDALRTCEPDAGGGERVARILVGAGADRLDEGEPRGARDELVAPQHRDAEDVEFAEPRRELVEAAHLEMPDVAPTQGKALRHAIGDVGKTVS